MKDKSYRFLLAVVICLMMITFGWFYGQQIKSALADYYDLQHNSVVPDTTTARNIWYWRGDHFIGYDSTTVMAQNIPHFVKIYSTGTVNALFFEGDGSRLSNISGFVTLAANNDFTGFCTFSKKVVAYSSMRVVGTMEATAFDGDGSSITNVGVLDKTAVWTATHSFQQNVDFSTANITNLVGLGAGQGDIIYYNGTKFIALSSGTVGQYLKTGTIPSWDTPAGGDGGSPDIVFTYKGDIFNSTDTEGGHSSTVLKNDITPSSYYIYVSSPTSTFDVWVSTRLGNSSTDWAIGVDTFNVTAGVSTQAIVAAGWVANEDDEVGIGFVNVAAKHQPGTVKVKIND
jgi:hypothetical protein